MKASDLCPGNRRLVPKTTVVLLLVGGLVLAICMPQQGPCALIPSSASLGWELLWENHVDSARVQFQTELAVNPQDTWVRRGLVLADLARGYERDVLDQLEQLSLMRTPDALDWLLTTWALRQITTCGKDNQRLEAIVKRLGESQTLDPLDRRAVLACLGELALDNANVIGAQNALGCLNRISTWSLLGPFDNLAGGGHDKDFLQRTAEPMQYLIHGVEPRIAWKAGESIFWYTPQVLGIGSEVNLGNHFPSFIDLTAYAGCAIESADSASYLLSISKSGALKAYLDGQLLLDDEEVSSANEFFHFAVDLPRGRHTLLLKGSGIAKPPKVAAALSLPDGSLCRRVATTPLMPKGFVDASVSFHRRELPTVERLDSLLAVDSLDPVATYWKLIALVAHDRRQESRMFAEAAARRFSQSALILHAAASAYGVDEDEEGMNYLVTKSLALDPAFAPAILWRAEQAIRQDDFRTSDSLLESATRFQRGFVSAEILLLETYEKRNLLEKAVEAARRIRRGYSPDFQRPLEILADYHEASGDFSFAEQLREAALVALPRRKELVRRYAAAAEKDDKAAAKKHLTELATLFPDSPSILSALAWAKLRVGDAKGGIAACDHVAELFPYSVEAQSTKARMEGIRTAIGESRKHIAVRHYERALALAPDNLQIRDQLRQLRGLPSVGEILHPVDFDAIHSKALAKGDSTYPDAQVLLDEQRQIVFGDGYTYFENIFVGKIFTQAGAERFRSIGIDVNSLSGTSDVQTARTVKPDGRVVEATVSLGKVVFSSLEPGDELDLQYRSHSYTRGQLKREFWGYHAFAWDVPCKSSRYVLLLPREWKCHTRLHNTKAPFTVEDSAGALGEFDLHVWSANDIPAATADPYSPPARDVRPWLDVSTIDSWNEVADWYLYLSEKPSKPDPFVMEKANSLIAEIGTPESRIRRLCSFVTNEVGYENLPLQFSGIVPRPCRKVLQAKYGDCKDQVCLLRAMLATIGVESHFALVSPVKLGVTAFLPSPRFTHAILAIPKPGGYTFVDPTAQGVPYGQVSSSLCGAKALVIRQGEDSLSTIFCKPSDMNATTFDTEFMLKANGTAVLRRREVYRQGDDIARQLDATKHLEPAQRKQWLLHELGRKFTNLRLLEAEWQELNAGTDSVIVAYAVSVDSAWITAGGLHLVSVPWRSSVTLETGELIADSARQEPLAFLGLVVNEQETARLQLPSGWRLTHRPPNQQLECPYGLLAITYMDNGSQLLAQRQLQIEGTNIPPDDYPRFREFLANVIRAQKTMLIVRSE